jgi:hypothetical protein
MSIRPRILALLALAALAGCGDQSLVLRVDVLSYMDPALTTQAIGPVPAVPGGAATGEQVLVPDQEVNLVEGLSDVATVQTVSITAAMITRDSTGSGTDTLRIYLSDVATAPSATTPALTRVLTLAPGSVDTLAVDFDGDPRVAALFAQRRFRIEVTTSLRGPTSGAALNGTVRLSRLDAVLVAKRRM